MACKKVKDPVCRLPGACFARSKDKKCTILKKSYTTKCPFQKEDKEFTNGIWYPFDPYYSPEKKTVMR